MRRLLIFLLMLGLLIPFGITVKAHPGRTDSNGGHKDSSTDEYHYHHGYPAHDHYDMDGDGKKECPYDFKENTSKNIDEDKSKGTINIETIVEKTVTILITSAAAFLLFGQITAIVNEDISARLFHIGFLMFAIAIPFGLLILLMYIF